MAQSLPADQARCHGFQCPTRERCLRHTDRQHHKADTPFVSHLCEGECLEHYIPAKEQK
jgi:hypothetical protein